jgi:predicted phosphoribosyltransferase
MLRFSDRREAGRLLASLLGEYTGRADVVVMPIRMRAAPVAEGLSAVLGARRLPAYADSDALAVLGGSTVILVDDGFDSIDRMREAMIVARGCDAVRIVAAGPVGTVDACHAISSMVDRSVCLSMPTPFRSVGFWYDDSFRAAARAVFVGQRRMRQRHEEAGI